MTIVSAVNRASPPSFNATRTSCGPVNDASPKSVRGLSLPSSRSSLPARQSTTMSRLRCRTVSMSTVTAPVPTP